MPQLSSGEIRGEPECDLTFTEHPRLANVGECLRHMPLLENVGMFRREERTTVGIEVDNGGRVASSGEGAAVNAI